MIVFCKLEFVQSLSNFFATILSFFGEGLGGSLIGGFLGLLGILFTNDFNARKECCHTLYELKKLLGGLAFYRSHPNQGEKGYCPIILDLEKNIEKLDVEVSGLCFRPQNLDKLIRESMAIFKAFDPNAENPNFRPPFTASRLMQTWAASKRNRPCLDTIISFQKFLKSAIFYRARNGRMLKSTLPPEEKNNSS